MICTGNSYTMYKSSASNSLRQTVEDLIHTSPSLINT